MNELDTAPAGALEDIAYLSRSSNRLQMLDALARGACTRRDLEAATDASRPTLRRILAELADRGWAERTTDGDYVATAKGERVVTAFRPLVGAMQAVRELDETVSWLPSEELSIGLHHFSDATVRRADPSSPAAEATYLLDLLQDAATLANLTYIAPPLPMLETMRDGVVSGRLTATNVVTPELLSYLQSQPDQTPYWREYVDAGARVYCYEGAIPCNLFVVDERVLVANNQPERGRACEFVESEDETVLSWARELLASYRADADRLDAAAFGEDAPTPGGRAER